MERYLLVGVLRNVLVALLQFYRHFRGTFSRRSYLLKSSD